MRYGIRSRLRTVSIGALLGFSASCVAAGGFSTLTYDDPVRVVQQATRQEPISPFDGAVQVARSVPYFSPQAIDEALTAEEPLVDPEFELVQREEPITGYAPEEQVLRQRVQQGRRQGQPYYGTFSPNASTSTYGTNSLLSTGPYGGYIAGLNTGKRWYVSVAQTAGYVTNLALPLIVTPGNVVAPLQDDAEFQTNVYAQYRIFGNEKHSLTTAFNFYQSLHPKVEQLDLTSYAQQLQYARVINCRLTSFTTYTYSYYLLDHQSLLNSNSLGGGFTYLTQPRTYWTVVGTTADNHFRLDPTQSSITNLVQLQRLQYVGRRNFYWLAGYAYGHNNAEFNAWSYDAHNFTLGGGRAFGRCLRNNVFVYGNYGVYDFDAVNAPLGDTAAREDNIYSLSARYSRNVGRHGTLFAQWTHFNSNSNIARQDFTSNLYQIGGLLYY